jgi:hypothetical protein
VALSQVLQEFNRRIYKLYGEWKAKKLTTFALQVQPFSANRTVPFLVFLRSLPPSSSELAPSWWCSLNHSIIIVTIPNLSYLSTLDCFHPSLLAHQKLAIATWNRYRLHSFTFRPQTWGHLN